MLAPMIRIYYAGGVKRVNPELHRFPSRFVCPPPPTLTECLGIVF